MESLSFVIKGRSGRGLKEQPGLLGWVYRKSAYQHVFKWCPVLFWTKMRDRGLSQCVLFPQVAGVLVAGRAGVSLSINSTKRLSPPSGSLQVCSYQNCRAIPGVSEGCWLSSWWHTMCLLGSFLKSLKGGVSVFLLKGDHPGNPVCFLSPVVLVGSGQNAWMGMVCSFWFLFFFTVRTGNPEVDLFGKSKPRFCLRVLRLPKLTV